MRNAVDRRDREVGEPVCIYICSCQESNFSNGVSGQSLGVQNRDEMGGEIKKLSSNYKSYKTRNSGLVEYFYQNDAS